MTVREMNDAACKPTARAVQVQPSLTQANMRQRPAGVITERDSSVGMFLQKVC